MSKKYIVGVFDDEHQLLEAIKVIRTKSVKIFDVLTPFAVHGMDEVMGWKRTRITVIGFISGMLGALIALGFMGWIFMIDWPINFGGKANFPLLAFIPITFEATVLSTAFGMIIAFMASCKLAPGVKKNIFDKRASDDKFIIVFDVSKNDSDTGLIRNMLHENGASEVNEKEIENNP